MRRGVLALFRSRFVAAAGAGDYIDGGGCFEYAFAQLDLIGGGGFQRSGVVEQADQREVAGNDERTIVQFLNVLIAATDAVGRMQV